MQYIAQELAFICSELDEVLEDHEEKGPIHRLLHRLGCFVRPPVIDIIDGKRYRPNRDTREALRGLGNGKR